MSEYELTKTEVSEIEEQKTNTKALVQAFNQFKVYLAGEWGKFTLATVFVIINALMTVAGPIVLAYAIDDFLTRQDFQRIIYYAVGLVVVYALGSISNYLQILLTGQIGQDVLYRLREAIFKKVQEMPVAFFNANKTGDLISRINSDTNKLNSLFSEILVRLLGSVFVLIGIGIFVIIWNVKLGLIMLTPAFFVFIYTRLISPWLAKVNKDSREALGNMSAEIQESLNNFKVIIAFNRRDYFREKFADVNQKNYEAAFKAGLGNNISNPVYTLAEQLAVLLSLTAGIYFVSQGDITIGMVVAYIGYVERFYGPIRELGSIWASMQSSIAAWRRIREILDKENNLQVHEEGNSIKTDSLIKFDQVGFEYSGGKKVLDNINFELERGKKYAFVGPTGGGKTTTASLIMRLFDPTEGDIYLNGRDLRSVPLEEKSEEIGFILQEPMMFSGTVAENIMYGNSKMKDLSVEELKAELEKEGLYDVIARFKDGLETKVGTNADNISLGQKQLVAFIRAALRKPKLLILDEATANIDTVTEKQLQSILDKLPKETTQIIIAHRLNTIKNADEILFVNGGHVEKAGSFEDAVNLINTSKRVS